MRTLFILMVALVYATSPAQETFDRGSESCSLKKSTAKHSPVLEFSPSSPRHSYDALDYNLDLDLYNCFLSPYPNSFRGKEIVTFRIDTALSAIALNAVNTSLVIDSVGLAGLSYTHTSNILTITLDRTYAAGETAQVAIHYRHNDVQDYAFYASGGFVFTDAEPEGARKWFACWDKPSDKATLSLRAKVPISVKLGSNGRLADSTTVADTTYYHWISRDPIATYLMVMSARVNYVLEIVLWPKLSNPSELVPIRFYSNPGENTSGMRSIINPMTDLFSTLFGEHPFEKNGFATLNNEFSWGGMENQTLTSLRPGGWYTSLISHEYAHQWFGDMISPGTWADLWLNEGFATYCEALWLESANGYASYKSDILSDASSYLSGNPGWPIYNPSWAVTTPPNSQLFNYAITYAKGAGVLHMLRYTLGDSLFFAALSGYATDTTNYRLKNAVTADFVQTINQLTGQDLNWFFNQWIYQPNHPQYANLYSIKSAGPGMWSVGFKVRQTQSNPAFFTMPIQLRIVFQSGPDSTMRVMNTTNNQTLAYLFDRQPLSVQFDPTNEIVLKQASLAAGQVMTVPALLAPANADTVFTDPTPLTWTQSQTAIGYHLQVATDPLFTSLILDDTTLVDTVRNLSGLTSHTEYYWRVRAFDNVSTTSWSLSWSFTTGILTSVGSAEVLPAEFLLEQNFPNPFNPSTIIRIHLPVASMVSMRVFDLLGREVTSVVDEPLEPGIHSIEFSPSGLASGMYFYQVTAGSFVATRRMILMR
ncbi:MAG TPA: M1 family aminopeptidase [Bacteroidota bacterium]